MIPNKMKTVQLKMREARFWPAPQLRGKDKKFQFALKIGWRGRANKDISQLAEEVGFEPTVLLRAQRFSRPSP